MVNLESKKTKIHDVNNGKVLALELDADHMLKNQDRGISNFNVY